MVPALYFVYNKRMYYVYVIRSLKTRKLYFGFSSDLSKRLHSHNSGLNNSTKHGVPWELIYVEGYKSERDARLRELKLKDYGNSRTRLKKRLEFSLL